MQQYEITGMSCVACSARVEKAVSAIDGVSSCSVSLLTNSMSVEGSASTEAIEKAVENAGYGIKQKGALEQKPDDDEFLKDTETPVLKKRLLYSLIFLVILMYFSMGHSMLGLPIPVFFENNPLAIGLVQMLFAVIVMVINQKFFTSGFKAIVNKSPNMDTLVALGSGASFVYSIYALFAMTDAYKMSNMALAHTHMHELYFESAAMILALITVGKMLESHSKGKTTNALKSLVKLKPKTATIISNGEEMQIPADNIKKDDIFIVRPGESFPTDGIIIEGHCAVNESALTGESIPVDKVEGNPISAATINQSGYVKCRATKTSEDTVLAQIIKMVSDAATTKAPIAKVADRVSGVFVPIVIAISIITLAIWLWVGESFGFALSRGISVLVISCPCALGLATPVAIMVGSGVGAKAGILFKTSAALEEAGRIQIVALDKTGTITNGNPVVTDIIPASHTANTELLTLAYSLEAKSEHPLSRAIVAEAKKHNLPLVPNTNFSIIAGNGLSAEINSKFTYGGNLAFVSDKCKISQDISALATSLASQGKTPLFFASDGNFIGIIAVADTIKPDSPEAIRQLKNMGIKTVMLTGDNIRTANAIKELCNVDEVIAEVMPAEKESVIKKLKNQGKVAMVGDGINDAPALTSANIGIAIGAGTDVAIDAADIVLMKSNLTDVPASIRLSRAALRNIRQNLFWAFIYNIIGIPLAAGLWIPLLGLKLSPMFGAAAMSLSSFCVVTNALRLNFLNLKDTGKNKKVKEIKSMEKTMHIEGMMCGHCEARVKQCLEALDGVTEAIVSHQENFAKVILSKDIPDDVLRKTVEDQGYKVL